MIFNSFTFLVFFLVVFILYWFAFSKKVGLQNLLVLLSSYVFYAWYNWHLLFILIGSTTLNYFLAIYIEKTQKSITRKTLVLIGVLQGIGLLFLFKYANFFITSFNEVVSFFGIQMNLKTLNLIVPLGISFYTFRIISYLLDVDKQKMVAVKNWTIFSAYVSFFPSLISGPIDKAKTLVPQLESVRTFNYQTVTDGLRQILWGLFKKVVIADNCATFTNSVFDNHSDFSTPTLWLGALFYTIQIYADFSGYSDMAIGIAKLIGFSITKNFDFPFFSQNIAEFWRKWHMSLTGWLTEYVFTPLTIRFRDYENKGLILAIIINFTIIGLWHGANWTYVLFGFLHGCYYIPLILSGKLNKKKIIAKGKLLPNKQEIMYVLSTFILVMLTFVLFRSINVTDAIKYYSELLCIGNNKAIKQNDIQPLVVISVFSLVLFTAEWLQRTKNHGLQIDTTPLENITFSKIKRWSIYFLLIACILCFGGKEQDFIYFKF